MQFSFYNKLIINKLYKKMKNQIFAIASDNYLSDFIKTLPSKCLFDKGKVGCGGTTLAITDDNNYLIAVPFVSLIENKVAQHKNELFGFYGGVTISDLKEYIKSRKNKPVKIITTYDSIDKIINKIDPSEYKLLVDEYHLLFLQYSFRDKAINGVLNNFKKFSDYTFMTATPIEDEFILEELKDLDVVECVWPNEIRIRVKMVKCVDGVLKSTVDLINNFLNNSIEGNLYLFVNSTEFIANILKNIDSLTEENCNLIYGKSSKVVFRIKRGVLPCYKDGRILPKKINLLTSTAFEGTDIYDEEGRTVIVSDPSKAHTLLDISTTINQIAGRTRNSKYINEIMHYYKETRYNGVDIEEFKNTIEINKEDSKKILDTYNSIGNKKKLEKFMYEEWYINSDGKGNFFVDENKAKLDLFQFKLLNGIYSIRVKIAEEYLNNNYEVSGEIIKSNTQIEKVKKDLNSFEACVKRLKEIQEENKQYIFDTDSIFDLDLKSEVATIYTKYDFLKEAIEKFGFEFIEKMRYRIVDVKRKLIDENTNVNTAYKIFKKLELKGYKTGFSDTNENIKQTLQKIYDSLKIERVAKATDINYFFYTKRCVLRKNDKRVEGLQIINNKTTFILK